MSLERKALIDYARALFLPVELFSCAAENRGMPEFVSPDDRSDRLLTSSCHLLLPASP